MCNCPEINLRVRRFFLHGREAHGSIGAHKIGGMLRSPSRPFVLCVGGEKRVVRKALDPYIQQKLVI